MNPFRSTKRLVLVAILTFSMFVMSACTPAKVEPCIHGPASPYLSWAQLYPLIRKGQASVQVLPGKPSQPVRVCYIKY